MRAALFKGVGSPLSIEEIQLDKPAPQEVIIRTVASGVCHSDLHYLDGKLTCPLPAVLGHEASGIVEEVGELVTYVKPGDPVVSCLSVFCGHCKQCLSGFPSCCKSTETKRDPAGKSRLYKGNTPVFQFYNIGSFAEKMLLHQNSLVKVDHSIPLDIAAIVGCAVVTGLGAVFNTAQVKVGNTIAVFGCGGVGISLIQGAKIAGARTIIAVDVVDDKLKQAKEFGATHTINSKQTDPVEAIMAITANEGVDFSFECIGNKQVLEQAFYCLATRGTTIMLGLYADKQKVELLGTAFYFEKGLRGSRMGSNRFRVDIPTYLDFYKTGRLKLDELVSQKIKLEEINDAFRAMKAGEVIRSVIIF